MNQTLCELDEAKRRAVIVIGGDRRPCYIDHITDHEFQVWVNESEPYVGDSRAKLVTDDAVYSVKIIRQLPQSSGTCFKLKRLPVNFHGEVTADTGTAPQYLDRRSCVACLAGALIVGCCYYFSSATALPQFRFVEPQDNQTSSNPSQVTQQASIAHRSDHQSQEKALNQDLSAIELHLAEEGFDKDSPTSTFVVSLSSPTFGTAETEQPMNALGPQLLETKASGESADRQPFVATESPHRSRQSRSTMTVRSRKALLEQGQIGRAQWATREMLPWLFIQAGWEGDRPWRLSDAALGDLEQFEVGLRTLPEQSAIAALANLRATIRRANTEFSQSKRVSGMTDVMMISGTDANVFFRLVGDKIELIRVLPVDLNSAERR